MNKLFIPCAPLVPAISIPNSPFHQLQSPSRSELAETRSIPAAEWRLLIPNFIELFRWETIRPMPDWWIGVNCLGLETAEAATQMTAAA